MTLPVFLLRRGSFVIIGGGGVWLSRRRRVLLDEDLRAERLALAAIAADRRRVVTGIAGIISEMIYCKYLSSDDSFVEVVQLS
jgi:hypothetical protein